MNNPPFFIIGNPRSGTTLLRLMLTSNPKVSIPPEAGFAVWFYKKYEQKEINLSVLQELACDIYSSKKFDNWNLSLEEIKDAFNDKSIVSYTEAINKIYMLYAIKNMKPTAISGDKNNFYLSEIATILLIWPTAKFIHIIRDGRNVACSYKDINKMKLSSPSSPKLPSQITDIATEWSNNNRIISESLKYVSPRNYVEIKLEDLISNNENILKELCRFLGVEFSPEMIEYYKGDTSKFENMEWKKKNKEPLVTTENEKYLSFLTKDEIKTFESIGSKTLKKYGYMK